MIRLINTSNLDSIKADLIQFISSISYGRYLNDPSFSKEKAVIHEFNKLRNYAYDTEVCIAYKDDTIVGVIGIRFSDWDSSHFDFPVGKIDYFLVSELESVNNKASELLMDYCDQWVKKNAIKLMITKVDSSNFAPVLSLQKKGYIFYECSTIRTKSKFEEIQAVDYRFVKQDDIEELKKQFSHNTFAKSHFYLDKKFDVQKVDFMYEQWINNVFESKSEMIVIEQNNKYAGIFIFRIDDYSEEFDSIIATWEFASIAEEFRNKGLGKKLYEAAIDACLKKGAVIIDTDIVDKNIISQKLHDKLGFHLSYTLYTFHKWF